MKWFKHYSDASDGLSLKTLWANKDYEAIAVWWRILEMLGKHNVKDGILRTNFTVLGRETGMKPSKCRRVLARISSVSLVRYEHDADEIQPFLVPKWSELQETRGQKKFKSFGKTPGEVRSKKIEDRSSRGRESFAAADPNLPSLLDLWNQNCGDLPKMFGVGKEREELWAQRWASRPDLNYWVTVIRKMANSKFCGGSGTWTANVDWLIKNDTNHQKVIEGKYDDDWGQAPKKIYVWPDEPNTTG